MEAPGTFKIWVLKGKLKGGKILLEDFIENLIMETPGTFWDFYGKLKCLISIEQKGHLVVCHSKKITDTPGVLWKSVENGDAWYILYI